jgi:hypothetical protein
MPVEKRMDETRIILGCLLGDKHGGKNKRKKLKINEIDPISNDCGSGDAITRMADKAVASKRNRKDFKYKVIDKWGNRDFLVYIDSLLSQHGLELKTSGIHDQDLVNKLYDCLLIKVGESMNNKILKEYIEWWIASKSRKYQHKDIYMQSLLRDSFIDEYITDIVGNETCVVQPPIGSVNVLDLYKAGGISAVLLSKGIVICYNLLKSRQERDIINRISASLRSFSKEMIQTSMDATVGNAPYDTTDIVDFMSIARQSLEYHGIKKYSFIEYKNMFVNQKEGNNEVLRSD